MNSCEFGNLESHVPDIPPQPLLRIYWDQATVLVQIGVLDRASLPVTGVEQARKFEHPQLLIEMS